MRKRRKMKVVQDKSLLFCYHIVHEILLLFENEQNGLGHRKGEEMNSCAILLRNIMENPDFSQRQLRENRNVSRESESLSERLGRTRLFKKNK